MMGVLFLQCSFGTHLGDLTHHPHSNGLDTQVEHEPYVPQSKKVKFVAAISGCSCVPTDRTAVKKASAKP
jgi:hypothetical protein